MKRSKSKKQGLSVRKAAGAMAAMLALAPVAGAITAIAAGNPPVRAADIPDQLVIKGGAPRILDLSEFFSYPDEGDSLTYSIRSIGSDIPGIASLSIKEDASGTAASQEAYAYEIAAADTVGNVTYSNLFSVRTASSPEGNRESVIKYRYSEAGENDIYGPLDDALFADEDGSMLYITVSPSSIGLYSSGSAFWEGGSLNASFIINGTGTETVTLTARDDDYRQDGTGTGEAVSRLTLDVRDNRAPFKKIAESEVPVKLNSYGDTYIDLRDYFDDEDLSGDFYNPEVLQYSLQFNSGSVNADAEDYTMVVWGGPAPGQTVPVTVRAKDSGGKYSDPITFNLTREPGIEVMLSDSDGRIIDKDERSELGLELIPPAGFGTDNVYLRSSEVTIGASVSPENDIAIPVYGDNLSGYMPLADIPDGEYWLYTLDSGGIVNIVSEPFLIADLAALKPLLDLDGDKTVGIDDIVKLQSSPSLTQRDVTKDGVYDRKDIAYLLRLIDSRDPREGGV